MFNNIQIEERVNTNVKKIYFFFYLFSTFVRMGLKIDVK